MKYCLLIISTIVAVLQISDLDQKPVNYKAWSLFVLSLIGLFIGVKLLLQEEETELYKNDYGKIEGKKVSGKKFYIKNGDRVLTIPEGKFDILDIDPNYKGVVLSLELQNERILVNMEVRDDKGDLIAKMIKNEWTVNKNLTLDKNFTNNSFEVVNNADDVILQIELNGEEVLLRGVFYKPDGSGLILFTFEDEETGYKMGVSMIFKKGKYNRLKLEYPELKLTPLFKYPSQKYPGEKLNK